MGSHLRIGLIGASTSIYAACREALDAVGRGVLVTELPSTEALTDLDMMLLVVEPPHIEGVRRFGRMREVAPQLPVLVLASGLDVDHAVELVKFGAADLLSLPASKRVLARKIERCLRGTPNLTIESVTLSPLAALTRSVSFANNRSCFRARVPERLGVAVTVHGGNATLSATLVDLSLPSDEAPAGACLDVVFASGSGLSSSPRGVLGATLQLVIEAFGRTVLANALVRRCELLDDAHPTLRLGVTFVPDTPADEVILQHIWVESQRRESLVPAATSRTSVPPARTSVPPARTSVPPARASVAPPKPSDATEHELSFKRT